jgi:hypothetical protein
VWRGLTIAMMALGVAIAVPSGIVAGVDFKDALHVRANHPTPASFPVRLPAGDWEIFELTGQASGVSGRPLSFNHISQWPVDIDSSDIRVTGPGGLPIGLRTTLTSTHFESYTQGSRIYTGVVRFHAPAPGIYLVAVSSPSTDQVIVAHPLLDSLTRALGWIVAAVAGIAVLGAGLVLFIIDLDRRRRAKYPPWGGPGWYPPPGYGSPYPPPGYPPQWPPTGWPPS